VKGKPRALHVQEFSKKGNEPFKQALKDWIPVNNTDSWHVCAYITNQQMNNHPNEGRDMLTPHQIYYSQEDERTFEDILGDSAWIILTEVGWQVIEGVMEHLKKFHPDIPLGIMKLGDFPLRGILCLIRSLIYPLRKGSSLKCISHCLLSNQVTEALYCSYGKNPRQIS
jgi:hypothetical protein